MHAADMVELSYWDTSICFYLLFSGAVKHPELLLKYGVGDCDAHHNYRALKKDTPRLMEALGFPNWVRLENGGVFRGEEAFLLLLMRMRDVSAESVRSYLRCFGGRLSSSSRGTVSE
eukprot:g16623.t1